MEAASLLENLSLLNPGEGREVGVLCSKNGTLNPDGRHKGDASATAHSCASTRIQNNGNHSETARKRKMENED